MSHDIFISYSRKNLAAVKPIKEELEAHGFSCWMDLEGIESGSPEFTNSITSAINDSRTLLFFLSAQSQTSDWSMNELRFAKVKAKRIVLVRFNDDALTDSFIFNFGGYDIVDWRESEQKEKLLRDLEKWMPIRYARCSKERLEQYFRGHGDWEAVKSFMEENGVWTAFKFTSRVDEEHELTQKTLCWLKENRNYSDEQIRSLLDECREPRIFTKLSIYEALEKRGLWKATETQMRTTGLMDFFESSTNISEDDSRFLPIVEWLKRQGVDVAAILSEAEIIPM